MTVLFIILGILLIAGGVSCIFTPLLTFMNTGYFVLILVFVFGVFGIIKAIVEKRFGVSFVFSILSILLGAAMLIFPTSLLYVEGALLIVTAIWFVVMGIVSIVDSIAVTRKTGSKIWILQLIFGILAILVGGYSFFHPTVMAVSLGLLIGIYFIEAGFTFIFSSTIARD